MIIEVAVPLPINRLFSYEVSPGGEVPLPGSRVLVPFGRKHLIGIVAGKGSPSERKLKPVRQVLDRRPVLSDSLLSLGRWISWYYLTPLGEVYRGMLPPGLLSKNASPDENPEKFWPAKKQLAIVSIASGGEGAEELSPRQREALELLEGQAFPLLVQEFIRDAGASHQLVRKLAEKGLLRLEEIDLYRSPWRTPRLLEPERHQLSGGQQEVFDRVSEALDGDGFNSFLLHGVTASGKTEVYLNLINRVLERGKCALVLVPEIGLTPQISRVFRGRFGEKVAILHSGLSGGERFDQWRRIRSGRARIAVGTRSAIFAPLEEIGLIVVDEEHDSSYKQGEQPRYHGRDTALKRGQLEGAVVLLGSATPQLETFHNAERRKRPLYLELNSRVLDRPLPQVQIVDMRVEFERHGKDVLFSDLLRESIAKRLDLREQVLILLNRRGYAAALLCRSCGHTETCIHCSISLTYHQESHRLSCHYCNYSKSVPTECPECHRAYVYFLGVGTEKVQEKLQEAFPQAVIDRLDRDAVQRRGSYEKILGALARGQTQILVGTQMIAKGHDYPNVTLVGVLGADQGLKLADFRAAERTFQLLTQVAGRAGRGDRPGEVVIQSYYPNHYSLKYACTQDYHRFAEKELEFRKRFRYPPFTALASVLIQDRDRTRAETLAAEVLDVLAEERRLHSSKERMRILGPAAAPIERLKGDYRCQLLIKTINRHELHEVLAAGWRKLEAQKVSPKSITIDIDPIVLL